MLSSWLPGRYESGECEVVFPARLIERLENRSAEISWGRSGEREVLRGLGIIVRKTGSRICIIVRGLRRSAPKVLNKP